MVKLLAIAVLLSACGSGDKCNKAYEKLAPLFDKGGGKKMDKTEEVDRCKKEIKEHPEREAMLDCVIAIDKPTEGDVTACMTKAGGGEHSGSGKKTEADLQLNKLGKISKRIWGETGAFPIGHADAEPTCCGQPQNKCAVNAALWTVEPWKSLDFTVEEPHTYRYAYDGKDGKSFTAYAIGDADCDGKEATFTLLGSMTPQNNPQTTVIPPAAGVY